MNTPEKKAPIPMRVLARRVLIVVAVVELLFLGTTWWLKHRASSADGAQRGAEHHEDAPGSGR